MIRSLHSYKSRLLLLFFLILNIPLYAQLTVQIGTGTSAPANTLYSPVYRFSATSTTTLAQSNMVYTATELSTAGINTGDMITAIAFNKLNASNFVTPAQYTVYMANTSNTPPLTGTIASDWAGILLSHTVVYTDNAFNLPNVAGWVTITLTTPFIYTGGSLEIATNLVMAGNGGATGNFSWEYTTGFATSIIGAATGNSNLSTYKQRPNIKITTAPSTPCTTVSTAGTAVRDVDSACMGGPVQLGVTGYTTGAGIGIQWEESYGSNVWNQIPGATTAGYTATFGGPVSYRAAVSCNFGTPVYSNVVAVSQKANYFCYCSPFTTNPLHTNNANYITKVEIPTTTLSNTTTAVGAGGYTRTTPATSSQTATLMQVVNYSLNVTLSAATYTAIAWIDYDHSGSFDPGEETLLSNSGTTASGIINIPSTALTGLTGMRVRVATNATTYTSSDACLSSGTGYETEDYVINIIANIPCNGIPPVAGLATVSRDTLCVTGDVKLKLTGYPTNLGITINWQSSPAGANAFTDIAGANTDTFTMYGLTASTDFRARVTCTSVGGGNAFSNVKPVLVQNPQIATTIAGSRCGSGSVALYATTSGGGKVNWYAAPTGGSPLATGNVFVTPSISTTTPYYAAPSTNGGGLGMVGPVNPTAVGAGSGSAAAITTYHMAFDVLVPTTLVSVDIYPTAAVNTNGAIAIQDNANNTLITVPYTTTVTGGTTPQTIPINLALAPGTGYKMGQSPAIALFRNTAGAVYPYTSSAINIISNNFGPAYYYYFYNWQFTSGCEGTRIQVDATINPAGTGNLATGGTVVGNNQGDGTTVNYDAPCSDKVAAVTDAAGGNVLGNTSATVIVSPTVQTYNTKPYVARVHDITPASSGAATVTIYALQSEFNAYNSYVTSNSLSLPLLPTSASDPNASNIVVTQWHGSASAASAGPGG
ncbi:MAG TPA: GEVED domain-containing protein, partial [Flavipsychrobacter sp.]|nr:GEVED domain-containing protein [Flavipsychrobacter sp.]